MILQWNGGDLTLEWPFEVQNPGRQSRTFIAVPFEIFQRLDSTLRICHTNLHKRRWTELTVWTARGQVVRGKSGPNGGLSSGLQP